MATRQTIHRIIRRSAFWTAYACAVLLFTGLTWAWIKSYSSSGTIMRMWSKVVPELDAAGVTHAHEYRGRLTVVTGIGLLCLRSEYVEMRSARAFSMSQPLKVEWWRNSDVAAWAPWEPAPYSHWGFHYDSAALSPWVFPPFNSDDQWAGSPRRSSIRAVALPFWVLVVPLGMVMLWLPLAAYRMRRPARRRAMGLCPQCGYDLRASRVRCPECGRVADSPQKEVSK